MRCSSRRARFVVLAMFVGGMGILSSVQGAGEWDPRVTATHGDPKPPSPVAAGKEIVVTLDASYVNPPHGYDDKMHAKVEWQWSLSVAHNAAAAADYRPAQEGRDFTKELVHKEKNSSKATLKFTPKVQGFWKLSLKATARFPHQLVPIPTEVNSGFELLITSYDAAKQPFTMETMPNTSPSINNKYVLQIGTVEVLKDWKVRFTVPETVKGEVVWTIADTSHLPAFAVKTVTLKGRQVEHTASEMAGFTVYYTADGKKSQSRSLVAAEVSRSKFQIQQGNFGAANTGVYTRSKDNRFYVKPPSRPPAIAVTGEVRQSELDGVPKLEKFRWGFIQGAGADFDVTWGNPKINWNPVVLRKPEVKYYTAGKARSIPKNTNDTIRLGMQLYGREPALLGQQQLTGDTPSIAEDPTKFYPQGTATQSELLIATYELIKNQKVDENFSMWIVTFNTETHQYVSLGQWKWHLAWNTQEKVDEWKASPDKTETKPLTDPLPLATTSTSEYTGNPIFTGKEKIAK